MKQTRILFALALPFFVGPAAAELRPSTTGGFTVTHEITVPNTPGEAYDLFTGDIRPWWDHHVSEKPRELYIEPRPGGGFYEIFDEQGNGTLHATVIHAERGKLLRLHGPLGLAGHALDLVSSIRFEAVEDGGTKVTVNAHAAGEVEPGWAEAIDRVWRHFLVERFQPYAASKH